MVKKYDDRTEMEVVRARLGGMSFGKIHQKYGLCSSSVYHILSRHGIVRKRFRRDRVGLSGDVGFSGGAGGNNWVRVLEGEPERKCSCCGKLFQPYVLEYQVCRRLCYWCYTGDEDDGERRCGV